MSKKYSSPLLFALTLLISSSCCGPNDSSKPSDDIFSKFLQEARNTGKNNGYTVPLNLGSSNQIGDFIALGSDKSYIKIAGGEDCFGELNADISPVSIPLNYETSLNFGSNSKIESILKIFEIGLGDIKFGISYDNSQNAKIKISEFEGKSASLVSLSEYFQNLKDDRKKQTCYDFLKQSNSANISILIGSFSVKSVVVSGDSNTELKLGNEIKIEEVAGNKNNSGKIEISTSPAKSQYKYQFSSGKVPVSGQYLKTDDAIYRAFVDTLRKNVESPTPTPTPSNPNQSPDPILLTTQGIFGCWQKQNSSEQACFGESAILQKYPNLSEEQKNLIKAAAPHVYVLNEANKPPSIFKQYEVLNEKLFLYEDPAKCAKISKIQNQLHLPNFVETSTGNCNETGSLSLWDPLTTGAPK